jgi:hypothetical protein
MVLDELITAEEFDKRSKHGTLINNNNTAELPYYKALNLLSMNMKKKAITSLNLAQEWYLKVGSLSRPCVEEFYTVYQ